VITIPARAMVVLVGGDISEDIFVKIRFEGKSSTCCLKIFAAMQNCRMIGVVL